MNSQSIDTNVKTEQKLISLLREKSTAQKFAMIRSLSQSTVMLSKRAIVRANQGIDDDQINIIFIDLHYGSELARQYKRNIDKKHENA
ncbi:hypothetical protein GF407_10420 [candidate division KSB1 bacterium]|nr:hypothetical protein [candidate division KSB1 bacterium]